MPYFYKMEERKIVPFGQYRFAIAEEGGKIVDDAQGYGYRTRQKAFLAMNWKFKGGRQKAETQKSNYKKWVKEDSKNKELIDKFNEYLEWNFKELARNEVTIDEIWNTLESEYGIKVPDFAKKQALK